MRKIILILFILSFGFLEAQEFSYGVVLKSSFYHVGNNNGVNQFSTESKGLNTSLTFGGYGEFNFSNNLGVKTELTYLKREIIYSKTEQLFTFSYFSIAPNFKYDFGDEYRQGFYMLVGPKISLMTSAKSEGEDVKESFENFLVGAQLGFGWRVFKYVDLETKFEYDLLPFFKLDNGNQSKFFGITIGATVDLERIISK